MSLVELEHFLVLSLNVETHLPSKRVVSIHETIYSCVRDQCINISMQGKVIEYLILLNSILIPRFEYIFLCSGLKLMILIGNER